MFKYITIIFLFLLQLNSLELKNINENNLEKSLNEKYEKAPPQKKLEEKPIEKVLEVILDITKNDKEFHEEREKEKHLIK